MTRTGSGPGRGAGEPAEGAIAVIVKGYPRLSETFIAQELLSLERLGQNLYIVSLRHPTDGKRHPVHDEIAAGVSYLPEYLHDAPGRVLGGWRRARRRPGYRRARAAWLRDLRRDPSRNRVRRFGQAMVLAAELPDDVTRLHAHFLHTPASVARYASLICGLPWSCSAHAKDVWTTPGWEITEKLRDLDWLVTCTEAGRAYLAGLAPDADKVHLAYHGLDLERFPAPGRTKALSDGSDAADPVVLLSVGRLVSKKGFDLLLEALARLPAELHWRWVHVGGGERRSLERRARELGLDDRIEWRGSQSQQAVLAAYRSADLFVLPCRIDPDGDRDGLPNVLMEAQSQGLACVASRISGIPELIEDGKTGLLTESEEIDELAAALTRLIANPALRQRLGAAGQARVRADFRHEATLRRLAPLFGLEPPPVARRTGATAP